MRSERLSAGIAFGVLQRQQRVAQSAFGDRRLFFAGAGRSQGAAGAKRSKAIVPATAAANSAVNTAAGRSHVFRTARSSAGILAASSKAGLSVKSPARPRAAGLILARFIFVSSCG